MRRRTTSEEEAVGVWEQRDSFGAYLRGVREEHGISLRQASTMLGLSYSYLSKLETGARKAPPSVKALRKIASAYYRDIREVMYEAGFRAETLPQVANERDSVDARFHRLVTHPLLRPPRMDKTVEECIPPLVKSMWIDFALKLWDDFEKGRNAGSTLHVPMVLSGMLDEDGLESFDLDEATGYARDVRYRSGETEAAGDDAGDGDGEE